MNYAESIAVKEKNRGIVVLAIQYTPLYFFMKRRNYLLNPYEAGPLKTILDFDIYKYNSNMVDITDLSLWDINGLNYDDI